MSDGSKRSRRYRDPQVRKQVSIFLPAPEWRALRDEAARQRLPLTELCRRSIRRDLNRHRQVPPADLSNNPYRGPECRRALRSEE